VPRVTHAANYRGQQPIIDRHRTGTSRWSTRRILQHDSVAATRSAGKPIEISLSADKNAAAELIIETSLTATQEQRFWAEAEVIAEGVGKAAAVPAKTEISADVEAGPIVGDRRRVDRRRDRSGCRKSCRQRSGRSADRQCKR